jgi:uncharacterized protein (DUF58 family)
VTASNAQSSAAKSSLAKSPVAKSTVAKTNAAWPTVPEPFPPAFERLLTALLAQPVTLGSSRDDAQRARRAVLSQSGTFVGHRPYERGDDLRRIDWAAYARTGEMFVKQLEEEERRTATLLLDLSPSLLVGDPPRRLAMLRAAAVLGGLGLVRLDGLTVVAPGAPAADAVRRFTGAQGMTALLRHLAALPIVTSTPDEAIELVLRRQVPGRVHWVSDFAEPAAIERPLLALRRRGARVTGWLPELPSDREGPTSGYLRLVDPESNQEMLVPVDAPLAAELKAQLAALAVAQNRLFSQAGARLWRWPASACDELQCAAWLPFLARCAG